MLGLQHVRPLQKHLRTQTRLDLAKPAGRRQGLGQARLGHLGPDQQVEGVLGLGQVGGEAGHVGTGRLHAGLGLVHVEFGGHAAVEARPGQVERVLLRRQGLPSHGQQILVAGVGEPGGGRLGDQAHLDGPAVILLGKELIVGRAGQAAGMAEKVDLPIGEADRGAVEVQLQTAAAWDEGIGRLFVGRARSAGDRGEQGRALYGDLPLGRLDVGHRHPEVTVVGQGHLDHRLQVRIGEESLPADRRGLRPGGGRGIARPLREARRNGRRRPVVGRVQIAGAQQDAERERGQPLHALASASVLGRLRFLNQPRTRT